jgi:hypothetical protein
MCVFVASLTSQSPRTHLRSLVSVILGALRADSLQAGVLTFADGLLAVDCLALLLAVRATPEQLSGTASHLAPGFLDTSLAHETGIHA